MEKLDPLDKIRSRKSETQDRLTAVRLFQQRVEELLGLASPRDRKLLDTAETLSGLAPEIQATDLLEAIECVELYEKVWPVLIQPEIWESVTVLAENAAGQRLMFENEDGIDYYTWHPGETALAAFRWNVADRRY